MIQISTEFNEEIPSWDVALESLLSEEYRKRGHALRIEDFHELAEHYAIRFDDIMATLFELVFAGRWQYLVHDAPALALTRERVERLYVNGRLDPKDVRELRGDWSPGTN